MHLISCSSWIAFTWRKICEFRLVVFSDFYYIFSFVQNLFTIFYICYRDDVVMKTALGVLGDLADTLGSNASSLIQQSLSCKDFLTECLSSDDHLIKESAEWAKLAITRAISV